MKHRLSLFAILFCLLAGRLFGAEAEREFKAGEDLLDAWRVGEAQALAAKALKGNPKSAAASNSTVGSSSTKAAIKKR